MSKLYTEEQVKYAIQVAFDAEPPCKVKDVLRDLTPIELPTDKTTRFEAIDGAGRRLVEHGVNIEISMQDYGRTMKVFLTKIKGGGQ